MSEPDVTGAPVVGGVRHDGCMDEPSMTLAEIRARDAAKGASGAGVTMTLAERDRRALLALLDEAIVRLQAVAVLAEPITCSPGEDSLVGYAIQDVAARRKTPAEAFAGLGDEWANTAAEFAKVVAELTAERVS